MKRVVAGDVLVGSHLLELPYLRPLPPVRGKCLPFPGARQIQAGPLNELTSHTLPAQLGGVLLCYAFCAQSQSWRRLLVLCLVKLEHVS